MVFMCLILTKLSWFLEELQEHGGTKNINHYYRFIQRKKANREMDKKFTKLFKRNILNQLDLIGFKDIEKKAKLLNNDIIFLTARTENYRDITLKQLEYVYPGINYPVYFYQRKRNKIKRNFER